MKMSWNELLSRQEPVAAVVHSLDQALYQVTVLLDEREHLLVENSGRAFRRHSLQRVREALQSLPVASLTLRQQSAYDEMIGQPRGQGNELNIRLGDPEPDP